ncbi:MAG: hypothetical protein ACREOH_04730 [Candidatus Entotheonellia bacterium]
MVFVGDSLDADVLGTITCGMHAIWLNRKRTSKPGVYGVHEISTLADLGKVITTVQTTAEAGTGADGSRGRLLPPADVGQV